MKHVAIVFNEDNNLVHVTEPLETITGPHFVRKAADWCNEHHGEAFTMFRIEVWEIGGSLVSTWMWELRGKVAHLYPI